MGDMYEKFEITDYDLENEFSVKKGRRPTKEQQIYGVWADEDDEDESEHNNRKINKGINFVSGRSATNERSKIDKDEEDDIRPSFSNARFKKPSEDMDQIAGLRNEKSNLKSFDKEFCNWEKNTKGIGSKLLLKMGFQPGKGLGKNLEGIATPIEAKPRKGKGAISFYGSESANGEVKTKSETDKKFNKSNEDKSTNKNRDRYFEKPLKPKVNYVYLDDDLIPKTDTASFNKLKIIDLTGPEEKVFQGYNEIHKTFNKTENIRRKFEDDSDDNNSDLDLDKQDNNKRIKSDLDYERHRLEELCNERVKFQKEIEFYEKKKQSYELIIERLEKLNNSSANLDELIELCKQSNDIELNCEIFYSFGFTILKHELRNWLPFGAQQSSINKLANDDEDDSKKHLNSFKQLNEIFNKRKQFYDQIVWHCWVPYVRMSIETFDDMRKSERMIEFFEEWNDLISEWIQFILLNQTVVNKLEQQVIEWNPMNDKIPIHLWIFPWLNKIKSDYLESIFVQIRKKLKNCLQFWNASDRSAKIILKPWQKVFGEKKWNEFLKECIVPKLEDNMSNFLINPKKQNLDCWNNLLDWKETLDEKELILILKKFFFPKWLKVLYNWLDNEPNFKEVSDWYLGWKKQFPEIWFNKELVVCQGFTIALKMIEFCIDSEGRMSNFEFNKI